MRPGAGGERALRIAMIGQRGIPATFGGIERHVEEVAARMADAGHDVTVFCRKGYVETAEPFHRGVRLAHLPAPSAKHFEAIAHSALSSALVLGRGFDIVHYHAVGPAMVAPLPRYLTRAKVLVTVHGLDGERAKWNGIAQSVLSAGTWMSARVPDATVVVSQALAEHYRERYGRRTEWITNGVTPGRRVPPGDYLASLGVTPHRYLLFVGRLVPEKAPHLLLEAFRRLPGDDLRLVVAGGSSFTDGYAAELAALAAQDPRIVMPGYVYGDDLAQLYTNAGAFVLPSDVEGLPLTLLEAISFDLPVVASDIGPHQEVLVSSAPGRRMFRAGDGEDLTSALRQVCDGLDGERAAAAATAPSIMARHDWDEVTRRTLALYERLLGGHDTLPVAGATQAWPVTVLPQVPGVGVDDLVTESLDVDLRVPEQGVQRGASRS